jgi:putative sporulation protein YtxC
LSGTTDEIRAKFQQDCGSLGFEGFRIVVDELNKGRYTFLGYNVVEGELSFRNYERIKNVLKNYMAQMLADVIVLREEQSMVRRIIDRNYSYFTVEERNEVFANTIKQLSSNSGLFTEFNLASRRTNIMGKIAEYLDTHHELVLDGFVTFRLKDYRAQLGQVVDKVVDEYMMELEYKEFIRVLRYFVEIQEPRVEEVHVVVSKMGTFKIVDSAGQSINNQYLENFLAQSADEINYDDLLITALITIAPNNIVLHNSQTLLESQDIAETIQNIFEDRVIICRDAGICPICY